MGPFQCWRRVIGLKRVMTINVLLYIDNIVCCMYITIKCNIGMVLAVVEVRDASSLKENARLFKVSGLLGLPFTFLGID